MRMLCLQAFLAVVLSISLVSAIQAGQYELGFATIPDPPILVGELTTISLSVENSTRQRVAGLEINLSLTKNDVQVFSRVLTTDQYGIITTTYRFEEAGKYTLLAEIGSDSASFAIDVYPKGLSPDMIFMSNAVVVLVIASLVILFLVRRKRHAAPGRDGQTEVDRPAKGR